MFVAFAADIDFPMCGSSLRFLQLFLQPAFEEVRFPSSQCRILATTTPVGHSIASHDFDSRIDVVHDATVMAKFIAIRYFFSQNGLLYEIHVI